MSPGNVTVMAMYNGLKSYLEEHSWFWLLVILHTINLQTVARFGKHMSIYSIANSERNLTYNGDNHGPGN